MLAYAPASGHTQVPASSQGITELLQYSDSQPSPESWWTTQDWPLVQAAGPQRNEPASMAGGG
jgi:hypothetical protein